MTQHDDTIALRHMRDHVAEAVELASERHRDDLDDDRVFALALTKLVEIVGEAAARVSRSFEIPTERFRGDRSSAPGIA